MQLAQLCKKNRIIQEQLKETGKAVSSIPQVKDRE